MREEDRPAPDKSWVEVGPEYDGPLTNREKRNLLLFAAVSVLVLSMCCNAGIVVGWLVA